MKAALLAVALGGVVSAAAAQTADRRIVVDPNAAPWNAIAKVQTNTGTHCTGALIAPSVVLTAAHCLYNRRTRAMLQPLSLHVLFGYERGGYRWHRLVNGVETGPGFDGSKGPLQSSDWARLTLADSVPVPPLPLYQGAVSAGLPVALAGYNRDRGELLLADVACQIRRTMPAADGTVFPVHDCAGTRGTSGAPLLTRTDGGWALVGINIAAGKTSNVALEVRAAR